jgi:GNAT superfamily N-acetyltransferase
MGKLTLAPMEAWDTVAVFPMLEQMAADEARPYPRQTPEDIKKSQSWLLDRLGAPDFGAFVVRDGHKAKGVIFGTLERRPFVQPAQFLEARLLYVAPSHRKRGIARKLAAAILEWGRSKLGPDCVAEIMALPDMPAYPMWAETGFRPIAVRMAWVDAEGQARPDLPLAPSDHSRETRAHG